MRTEKLMSWFVLICVFVAGAAFGIGGVFLWLPPPPPPPPPGPIEAMHHELALDDAQLTELHAIAERHRGELDAIAHETQQRVRTVLLAIEDELRPKLRPDQIAKLEAWRAHRGPPPPPPPPPPPR